MKKLLLLFVAFLAFQDSITAQNDVANYQIPNAGFEAEWGGAHLPSAPWQSYGTAKGKVLDEAWSPSFIRKMASLGVTKVEGYKSTFALCLTSMNSPRGKKNALATSGCVNMGSKDAESHDNYNYTDRQDPEKGNILFAGRPDSIVCMVKYTRGEAGDYTARINTLLHGDIDYKFPYETPENEKSYLLASSEMVVEPTKGWKRLSMPFSYTGVTAEKTYLLVNFNTSNLIGKTANDVFVVDDVQLVYNSELTKLIYDGKEYSLKALKEEGLITKNFEVEKLQVFTNAHAATTEVITLDGEQKVKVIVRGNDFSVHPSNYHEYVFNIVVPTSIDHLSQDNAHQSIFRLNGQRVKKASNGFFIINGKKQIL